MSVVPYPPPPPMTRQPTVAQAVAWLFGVALVLMVVLSAASGETMLAVMTGCGGVFGLVVGLLVPRRRATR